MNRLGRISYWWKAGPGPYVKRVLAGLGWGILMIGFSASVVGLLALTGVVAVEIAKVFFLSDPTWAFIAWVMIVFCVCVIGYAIYHEFSKNPIERRKRRDEPDDDDDDEFRLDLDDYGTDYDPYERSQINIGGEGNVQIAPVGTKNRQVSINSKGGRQVIE